MNKETKNHVYNYINGQSELKSTCSLSDHPKENEKKKDMIFRL